MPTIWLFSRLCVCDFNFKFKTKFRIFVFCLVLRTQDLTAVSFCLFLNDELLMSIFIIQLRAYQRSNLFHVCLPLCLKGLCAVTIVDY